MGLCNEQVGIVQVSKIWHEQRTCGAPLKKGKIRQRSEIDPDRP